MAIDDFRTQADAMRGLLGNLGVTDEDYLNADKAKVKAAIDSVEADLAADPLVAPQHYASAIKDEKGTFGLLKDAFFGEMKGPLAAMFAPDYVEAKTNYATDLAAYGAAEKERLKLGVMDPQVEAFARLYDEIDPRRAAYIRAANSVKEFDGNDYSLSEGQKRMSGFDNSLLAEGNERDLRTAAMRERDDMADKMGINDPYSQGSLLGVLTEPTITTQLADGTTLHSNAITPWLEQYTANRLYGPGGTGNAAGNPEAPANNGIPGVSSGGVTTEGAALAETRKALNARTAQEIADAPEAIRGYDKIISNLDRLGERRQRDDGSYEFVPNDSTNALYGPVDSFMPDAFRSGDTSDMKAEVDMLLGSLSIEERDKLKGTGTITDSEQNKLDSSISALSRGGEGFWGGFGKGKISDGKMAEHINIIYEVMENARARAAGLVAPNFQTDDAADFTQRTSFIGMSDEAFEAEMDSGRLKPGNVYTTPDGAKMRWDGKQLHEVRTP
jgi:hypothetical protein